MRGPEFEELLHKDWARILHNILVGSHPHIIAPHIIACLISTLSSRLDHYQHYGYITNWTIDTQETNHHLSQGHLIVKVDLVGKFGDHRLRVTLRFDSLYPPPGERWETPPKALNRWELIAMEIENEVLSDPQVEK